MSSSVIIGIDYSNNDHPLYTAALKMNGTYHVIDVDLLENFDYEKYKATQRELQFVGEPADIKRFKEMFKINNQITNNMINVFSKAPLWCSNCETWTIQYDNNETHACGSKVIYPVNYN